MRECETFSGISPGRSLPDGCDVTHEGKLVAMEIQTVIAGWALLGFALAPAVGVILRRQSRFYPPVR